MTVPSLPTDPIGPVSHGQNLLRQADHRRRARRAAARSTVDDADSLFASMDDEAAPAHAAPTARSRSTRSASGPAHEAATTDRRDLSIVERATGTWIGELAILDWDADNHSCGFRIALAPGGRDRGYGTEATRLIVDHVFTRPADPPHPARGVRLQRTGRSTSTSASASAARACCATACTGTASTTTRIVMGLLRPDWEACRPGRRPSTGAGSDPERRFGRRR